jgi:hypothetical protein
VTNRDLTASVATDVQAATIRPCIFYEGTFAGTPLRLWTGFGDKTWNGQTWTGNGLTVSIDLGGETSDLEAQSWAVVITGVPTAQLNVALVDARTSRNQTGTLWLGTMNSSGALTADPYQLQGGRFSQPVVDDAGDSCTIRLVYDNELAWLGAPNERHYTTADQQDVYASDRGFDMVPSLQDIQFDLWAA